MLFPVFKNFNFNTNSTVFVKCRSEGTIILDKEFLIQQSEGLSKVKCYLNCEHPVYYRLFRILPKRLSEENGPFKGDWTETDL